MKHGFIKVAAGTPHIKVADCAYNAAAIEEVMEKAFGEGVKLLVLPELCVTAYTCGDLFLQPALLKAAEKAVLRLAVKSAACGGMMTVVGLPLSKGGCLYNCAAVLQGGVIRGVVPKKHIANYNEFYERRNFSPAPNENSTINIGGAEYPFGTKLIFKAEKAAGLALGIELCEDLWVPVPPSAGHCCAGANVIANLSASDEVIGKREYRSELVRGQSGRLVCGYIYAAAGEGESTTDMTFAAHNMIAENGVMLAESAAFENKMAVSELDIQRLEAERRRLHSYEGAEARGYEIVELEIETDETALTRRFSRHPFIPAEGGQRKKRCEEILAIQMQGLKKRLAHTGAKTAVVGLSGGLDSCLAAVVAAGALRLLGRPESDLLAVTMPCFGTTQRTLENARRLARGLGASLRTVDISKSVLQHFKDIGHDEKSRDVTYENSQARERTQVLMDLANATGGLVVGTGDLSELALGWATYNGDHMSMYAVNSSVPKTLIRHIVAYAADTAENPELAAVLLDILDTPVSPELLPPEDGVISQKTEELVGPYELHDFFLYYAVRWAFPPDKVYRIALIAFEGIYEKAEVKKWLRVFYRRFFSQQFKRSCLPDGPKVGSVTLSPRGDWRMPSDASASLWLEIIEKL